MKEARWLITLGDLLTLLLGFAIATVALNPATKTLKAEVTSGNNKENIPPVVTNDETDQPGISLAKMKVAAGSEDGQVVFRFNASEIEPGTQKLTEQAIQKIKKLAMSVTYLPQRADIESCGEGDSAAAWFQSLSRAGELRRQLIDVGVNPQIIRVRARGAYCEEMVAVKVVFESEQVGHG